MNIAAPMSSAEVGSQDATARGPMPPALFVPRPGGVRATELTRGPWAHQAMHGGAICGLLCWAVEREQRRLGVSQVCTRLTVEILSGMPIGSYEVTATTIKGGRRTALIDAEIRALAPDSDAGSDAGSDAESGAHDSGRLMARATSGWLTPTIATDGFRDDGQPLPPIPTERANPGASPDIDYPRPGFNADAVDLRFVSGSTEMPGPGRTWARLDHPLVAGESTSPLVQVATLADLGAAVGWDFSPGGGAYINTDVTIQLLRLPVGEWIYFDSATIGSAGGLAGTHSVISDEHGLLGWVLQSQVEAPAEIGFPGGAAAARAGG